MGLSVTFIVLNVGHCPLVVPKGELTHLMWWFSTRLRTPVSLAQLVLQMWQDEGKIRGYSKFVF